MNIRKKSKTEKTIIEIMDRLDEYFMVRLSKELDKINTETKENKSSECIQEISLELCLEKAKIYEKIEKDFPVKYAISLNLNPEEFNLFRDKLVEIYFLENASNGKLYAYIKSLIEKELNANFNSKNKFEIIIILDSFISEIYLLNQLQSISETVFKDDERLLNLIRRFVFELKKLFNDHIDACMLLENLDFAQTLIYLALAKKCESSAGPFYKNFFNKIYEDKKIKAINNSWLLTFKKNYEDKKQKEFSEEIFAERQFGHQQVFDLCAEIRFYFPCYRLNRSPLELRQAFTAALHNENQYDHEKTTSNRERPSHSVLAAAVWEEQIIKGVSDRSESEKPAILNTLIQPTDSMFKSIRKSSLNNDFLESKKKISIFIAILNQIASPLINIQVYLNPYIKNESLSTGIYTNCSVVFTDCDKYKKLKNKSYIDLLESTLIPDIKLNLEKIYIDLIKNFSIKILKIIKSESWFDRENLSLKEQLKLFIKYGFFFVSLEKIKQELNIKINFDAIKDFFINKGFFYLLTLGIIRWPWLNKEDFAIKWAEQTILLKTKNEMDQLEAACTNKVDLLLGLLKICNEIFYTQGKKEFLFDVHPNINRAISTHLFELNILLVEASDRVDSKKTSLDNAVDFSSTNNDEAALVYFSQLNQLKQQRC